MRIMRLYLLILLTFLSVALSAQPLELSLEDALSMARQHNLSLQSNAIDMMAAQRDIDTSWNLFLPVMNLSLSQRGAAEVFHYSNPNNPLSGHAQANYLSGLNAGLSIGLTINPAVKQQLETYDLNYTIQQVTYAQAQSEVERNVTKLYYYLLAERENLALQEQNLQRARRQYRTVQARFEQGFASELEVLTAELGITRLQPAIGQAKNNYDAQFMALKALLGMPLESEVKLTDMLPELSLGMDRDALVGRIGASPALRLLDLNLRSLETTLRLQRSSALGPTISLTGQYGISTAGRAGGNATEWGDSIQYSVAVQIPLDGHIPNSRTQISLHKIQDSIDKLRLNRQQAETQLAQSIFTQVRALDNLAEQLELAQANKTLSERVYGMTLAQHESGYADASAVEDARDDLLSAEQNILYLRYQQLVALTDLAYDLDFELAQR